MQQIGNFFRYLTQAFDLNLGKFTISVVFWQVGAIIFLLFLLVLSMAQFRRHYVDWGLKGAAFGIFFGFLLALTLEGFLIVGGKTALTEFLGWKNAPLPLQMALDAGKAQLVQVLGINTTIPSSLAKDNTSVGEVVGTLQSLNPGDLKKIKNIICQP
ncbi:MAG TPA: hypothetical protein VKC54_05090 [Patescibacteria group bacterium]|nr:hypothetical protein [Patescibacteria group bacterium]